MIVSNINSEKNNKSKEKKTQLKKKILNSYSNITYFFSPFKIIENYEYKKNLSLSLIHRNKEKIVFKWKKEEKEMYLTGILFQLDKFLILEKKVKNIIYYKLNKIKKVKFQINGKIFIGSFYFINNNIKTDKIKPNLSSNLSTKLSSLISNNKSNNNNLIVDFAFSKKNYCNYYPKIKEFKEYPDKKPCHYPIECFQGVNYIQNEIGKKEFLNLEENDIFSQKNDSYKIIERKDHILLNHLFYKNLNNISISSIFIRFRHKNTTFIYYKSYKNS